VTCFKQLLKRYVSGTLQEAPNRYFWNTLADTKVEKFWYTERWHTAHDFPWCVGTTKLGRGSGFFVGVCGSPFPLSDSSW